MTKICMTENLQLRDDVRRALAAARARLLHLRCDAGFWRGQLSSSALSTAVAAVALHQVDAVAHRATVARALRWIAAHANADGGWGDTPDSPSNLSTTLLVWSALAFADPADDSGSSAAGAARSAQEWVQRKAGTLDPAGLAAAVVKSYGDDRTFSAPILTVCALAGRLGSDPWRFVPQLPYELALLPHACFRFVRLSVVSYALPALIAIGLVRQRRPPASPPPGRWVRHVASRLVLRVLRRCQPAHGGFLEAAPLTSFVAASLADAGLGGHPVARDCARFLLATVRPDGSWPIDTDLATWVTTLSINALSSADETVAPPALTATDRTTLSEWLLEQQQRKIHPYTHAAPGGWGWTNLAGSVPDADDTAGALLALHNLGRHDPVGRAAAVAGVRWLLDLQNNDGGMPTFCRGWGRLPFDRSCPDITAHVLRAFDAWSGDGDVDTGLRRRMHQSMCRAVRYLERAQQPDGSWIPLWFGNQAAPGQANRTYGTAQVVRALSDLTPGRLSGVAALVARGRQWLAAAQQDDGGWGGDAGVPPSIEETALAVAALGWGEAEEAVRHGAAWLVRQTGGGTRFEPAPIGLYFARLWYAEELYPVIFAVDALATAGRSWSA